MRVTPEHAALVTAVLDFANLRPIRSVAQVMRLFRSVPGAARVFQTIPAKDVAAFRRDQEQVRGWLEKIATRDHEKLRTVAEDVAKVMRETVVTVLDVERFETRLVFPGVRATYATGVALILSRSLGLAKRLGQCRAPLDGGICGRWRLDLEGKPARYCSTEHRRRFDAADAARRVRKWREATGG